LHTAERGGEVECYSRFESSISTVRKGHCPRANPFRAAMKRILILFAHPALQKSRVNTHLIDGVIDLNGVTVHDLYERYPAHDIDVRHEQALLLEHDIIVFHHPFFWYSTPPLLKEWQDLVLEHGWAYGSAGTALRGKLFMNAISTGGRQEAYSTEGYNRFTIRQLLAPLEQTARLCGMLYLPPFVVHGTHVVTPEAVLEHTRCYRTLLTALRDERIELQHMRMLDTLKSPDILHDLLHDDNEVRHA